MPDLLFAEAGNAIWKRVRRGEIVAAEARAAMRALLAVPFEVRAAAPILEPALELALALRLTVYDGLYLALAVTDQCPLVTADRKLHDAAKREEPLGAYVLWVADPLPA